MTALPRPGETLMAREAAEAPDVVAAQAVANAAACRELAARLRREPPRFIVTCARGSSDHAATYAKHLFELGLGIVTASVGPSVASVYRRPLALRGALFLAISQSGRSPDLLRFAEAAREAGALTVAVVNDAQSPLAVACEARLPLGAGPERSVAATKTCLASMSAVLQLAAHWAEDPALQAAHADLPDRMARARALDWGAAEAALAAASDTYVIGRGYGLAAAQEAALKLKETARMHAEAYSAAELMHGPLALIGDGFPVLVLSQDDETRAGVADATRRLEARGARVFAAEPDRASSHPLPVVAGVHPAAAPITLLQSFYGLAERVALARGLDPDRPPHLQKVTETL
jgi:glucosamine--fructose-6-phosphate aminotransferase (isomerizing)